MDRLTFVHDVCYILSSDRRAWRSSSWYRAGLPPTTDLENGYTDTVFSSRFFTWRRNYTKDGLPPTLPPPCSWITINEWVPGIWPLKKDRTSWLSMGNQSHHGIAYIPKDGDITESWSSHAKRHLKTFYKTGCTVRDGTFEDVKTDMLRSQVPRAMSIALSKIVAYRLSIDPENMNIFVAENKEGVRIGCFVAGNDEESKESMYLMGYFLPEAAKLQPMTGLVYTWLSLLQVNNYQAGNFGLMTGPHVTRLDPWWGLSNFKTHFGITRVHLPTSLWKISSSLFKKNNSPESH